VGEPPQPGFRGFAGRIASGRVHVGDRLKVLPSGRESRVARIVSADGDLQGAIAGLCVTITLTDEVDVSRGDVLVDVQTPPQPPTSSKRRSSGSTRTPFSPAARIS